jgi:perosamine synthetase
MAAGLLCAQIERHEHFLQRRRDIFGRYHELLDGVPGIGFRPVAPWATLSPWLFSITIDPDAFGATRESVMAKLAAERIESRPFFIPVHGLPPFSEGSRQRNTQCPVTDRLCSIGINLPTFTTMTDDEIARVAEVIRRMAKPARRITARAS